MLTCKYARFSLPKNVTYLNCAYMSPLLKSVEKVGLRGVRLKRNQAVIRPDDLFSTTRLLLQELSNLIHGQAPERIAIIPSASYGLAIVNKNL